MVNSKLGWLGIGFVGALALGAVMVPSAPAKADSFAFSYSSGYYPRHYRHHHHRHHHHHHGYRARYYAPPPVYYYPPPPPRVVYVNPPPAYYVPGPPPVAYQSVQPVPGGPLAGSQLQCREYQSTAVVNGQRVPSYGTACLQPDGSWQIVR